MNLSQTLGQAASHYQQGKLTEACNLCKQVLTHNPRQFQALQLLGVAYAAMGDSTQAINFLQRYLSEKPNDSESWYNLGVICQQSGQIEAAIKAYKTARNLVPSHLQAAVNLAVALEQTGLISEAEKLLTETIAENPNLAQVWLARGAFRTRNDQKHEAERDFKQVLKIDPLNASAHRSLGALQARDGRWQAAIVAYQKCLKLEPASIDARISLAKAFYHTNQQDLFEKALDDLVQLAPEKPEVLNLRAVLNQSRGDRQAAIADLKLAVEQDPKSPEFRFNLAAIYSKSTDKNDWLFGEQELKHCITLAPNHADAWHCLCQILIKLERNADALNAVQHASKLRPEKLDYVVTLGDFLVKQGQYESAIKTFNAYPAVENSAEVLRQLGIAEIKAGQYKSAQSTLRKSYQLKPSDQRTVAHLAVATEFMGQNQKAREYLGLDRHIYSYQINPPEGFKGLVEFNHQLAHDIEQHSGLRWESLGLAARNGALTEDLLVDQTAAIVGFERCLRACIEQLRLALQQKPDDPFLNQIPGPDYKLNLWATLVKDSGLIDTHIHEESWLSGAYYVSLPQLGDETGNPSGWIEFGRPHSDLGAVEEGAIKLLKPQEGQLLLFPSYLFHRTIPHQSTEPRISISFDLVPR